MVSWETVFDAAGVIGGLFCILAGFAMLRARGRIDERLADFKQRGDIAIQLLQTSGAKELYVYQQYLGEAFKQYKALWPKLIAARMAASILKHRIGPIYHDTPEDVYAEWQEEYAKLRGALRSAQMLLLENAPFYAPTVYEKAWQVTHAFEDLQLGQTPVRGRDLKNMEKAYALFTDALKLLDEVMAAIQMGVWDERSEHGLPESEDKNGS